MLVSAMMLNKWVNVDVSANNQSMAISSQQYNSSQ